MISRRSPPQSPQSQRPPMVSHAEVADQARRAPSISSRTSRSKHHHRGRSHQGGPSYIPQNEFPFFSGSGDVEIVISADGQEKKYLLHRLILAQNSGFFDAGTSEEWSRGPAVYDLPGAVSRPDQALARIGEDVEATPVPHVTPEQASRSTPSGRRWRYELDWDNAEDDDEPMLVQKPPSPGGLFTSSTATLVPPPSRPRNPPSNAGFFRSMANLTHSHSRSQSHSQSTTYLPAAPPPEDPALSNPVIRDYDNLFRIFYNYTPHLNSVNIASAYSECKSLLVIADMYDALSVVGSRIDHHLLRFSSKLFKQIAKYPSSYLKLGYLAHSRIIFSEALTHVVGQWPQPYQHLKPPDDGGGSYEIPNSVIELIEDKVDELEETKAKVEAKLFRLTLTTHRGERVNPTNDYLGWLAMSLFRQWLAENTTPPPTGILKNSTEQPQPPRPTNNPPGAAPNTRPRYNSTGANPAAGAGHSTPVSLSRPSAPPPVATGRVYRLIGSTNGQSYLAHEELKRFLKLHPTDSSSGLYSRDTLRRFERKVDEIKNIARDVVKPLVRNCLEVDLRSLDAPGGGSAGGLPYLTCSKLEEDEIPWD